MEPIQLETIRARRMKVREGLDRWGDAYSWVTGREYLGDVGVLMDAVEQLQRDIEEWKRQLQLAIIDRLDAEWQAREALASFDENTRAWQETRSAYEPLRYPPPPPRESTTRAITRDLRRVIEGKE